MTRPVRIPADVDRPDRILFGLTGHQLALLTTTGVILYVLWALTQRIVPLLVFLVLALPVAAIAVVLALGQRDGVSLDRLLWAAFRQRLTPRRHVAAPEDVSSTPDWITASVESGAEPEHASSQLRLPVEDVMPTGVVDLGTDGLALVAVASTVNFALRTPMEQQAVVSSFGRYLHSLTGPVQVLVRAHRLDLTDQIAELRDTAGGLSHPALERAAREHADFLEQLGAGTELLRRQVLLVLREPFGIAQETKRALPILRRRGGGQVGDGTRRAAEARLVRRLSDAIELFTSAGVVITPLDAGQATAVLAAACNPDTLLPPSAGLANACEVITTASDYDWEQAR
ncbi:PrgI family protein [Lentzea atacamensis]|uniref:PrgI family protein n=1 Tax=Lentzea atacamensis TaxID=531938 RepID=A0ABX9DXH7_9PSEU|nr:PrgI family protein [Lentzea atacamensis]RAS58968.1 PrgI family protein [Lentzea atacamensis]